MEIKKFILQILEIIFLIGGVLYLILGILSLFTNHELIDRLGIKFSENIKLEESKIGTIELKNKVTKKIAIELFISSIIDFILMIVCIFCNKSNKEIVNDDMNISLIDMSKKTEKENIWIIQIKNESLIKNLK